MCAPRHSQRKARRGDDFALSDGSSENDVNSHSWR
jgi:hypothetical protein